MDKQTLSQYGWIIIAVLILAVMLAFATPFGKYIGKGVSNLAISMVKANDNAVDKNNIEQMGKEWDEYLNPVKANATFNAKTTEGCRCLDDYDYHICFVSIEPITLTWKELKLTDNSAKYGYDVSVITDTTIGDCAFGYCRYLTRIELPDGITSIGEYAFTYTSLTNIDLSNTQITSIGKGAFENCTSLTSIDLPDSITSIGGDAFAYCTKLTNIILPQKLMTIEGYAFDSCDSLTSITLPKGITTIGEWTFADCYSLTNITFEGTMAQWNAITKGSRWNDAVPATVVHCSDGDVTL